MGHNETTPLRPDSSRRIHEESHARRISETKFIYAHICMVTQSGLLKETSQATYMEIKCIVLSVIEIRLGTNFIYCLTGTLYDAK